MSSFVDQYGPWALIAGGAQGIGAGFAREFAARGLNIAVIDNVAEALDDFLPSLHREFGVETLGLCLDLAQPDLLERTIDGLDGRQIGMLVYNAAIADFGPFYKEAGSLEFEKARIAVNVAGPMVFSYHLSTHNLVLRP